MGIKEYIYEEYYSLKNVKLHLFLSSSFHPYWGVNCLVYALTDPASYLLFYHLKS